MNKKKESELIVVEDKETRQPSMVPVPEGQSLSLIEMAVRRGDDLPMIEKLMDLQDRHDKKEAKKAFVTAMSLFKSEHLKIVKDKRVGYAHKDGSGRTDYSYSTLDNILSIAVPVLSKYGLSATWDPKQENGQVFVTCTLTHSLGHSESVTMQAAPDASGKKNDIQKVASAVTYLERYTFLAITGLSVGDNPSDDDGGGSGDTLSEDEVTTFKKKLGKCKTVKELDKVAAEAAKKCTECNDLKSYGDINKEYKDIKHLIEHPPE